MAAKAARVALLGFRRWGADVRYPLLLAMITVFLWWALDPVKAMAYATGYAVSPIVFPFLTGGEVNQLIIIVGALFLFSDAPFVGESQLFVLARTGRRPWVLGQALYIAGASACYVAVLLALSLIFLAPVSTMGTEGWGKVLTTLCYTDAGAAFHLGFTVPEKVLTSLTPAAALGLQLMLEWMAVAIVGLVVFTVNLFAPVKAGVFAGGLMALFDLLVTNALPFALYGFSPVSLARLPVLDFAGNNPYLPTVGWAVGFDLCLLATLVAFLAVVARRTVIDIAPEA
ncbi:MAG: hypothetical protein LBG81_08965 [Coriobacteriaceae bacterium]|jgi:hypothetical protein|nr:hypothetical protein [Coriobacteriaceae bacterium]